MRYLKKSIILLLIISLIIPIKIQAEEKLVDNPAIISAKNLIYSGEKQELLSVSNYTGLVYFSLDGQIDSSNYINYSTDIPKQINSGNYIIYYYIPDTDMYKEKMGYVESTIEIVNTSTGEIYIDNTEGVSLGEKGGLVIENGKTYYYENGKVYKGFKTIDGKIYYFGRGTGALQKNQWYNYDNKYTYYFDKDGVVATGLKDIGGKTYYFESDGKLHKGFKTIDGKIYYFGRGSGALQKNKWYNYDNKYTYYFDADGVVATGLKDIGGKTYYFESDGKLYKGFKTLDVKLYYFGRGSGALQKNQWYNYDNKYTYYLDKDGVVATGLKDIGGKTYYFESDGKLHKGFKTIDGKIYYFGRGSGALQKNGWYNYDNKYTYYFDADGVVATGLKDIGGKTYYFESDGKLHKGFKTIDGKIYYFGRGSGALQKNKWYNYDNKYTYYFDKDGVVITGEQTIDGNLYSFDSTGKLNIGWQTINGKTYYFYADGTKAKYIAKIAGKRYEFSADGVLEHKDVKVIADISKHQGKIDWDTLWKSGEIDGVILRVGITGDIDSKFAYNISEVKRLGIPYSVYHFSLAENSNEAKYEANSLINWYSKYSLQPYMEVYYDIEGWNLDTGESSDGISVGTYDSIIDTYISSLSQLNITAKLYSGRNYALTRLSDHARSYVTWIAQYATYCTYPYPYRGWQYTSKAKLPGITENTVDLSVFYY